MIEVFGTLLPDRTNAARSLFSKRPSASARRIRQPELSDERLEVPLLDVNLGPYGIPLPIRRQVNASEDPGFKLLPGILCQEYPRVSELRFDLIEAPTPPYLAVTIDTEDEELDHPSVAHDDFRYTARLQDFVDASKHGIFTNQNTCPWLPYGTEQRLEQRLQNELVVARIFGDYENPHTSSSSSSCSVKKSALSSQPDSSSRPRPC